MPIACETSRLVVRIRTLAALLLVTALGQAQAAGPTPSELAEARLWTAAHLEGSDVAKLPFSFFYGGKPSTELLANWQLKSEVRQLDPQRSQHTLRFTDPDSPVVLRCVVVQYHDFPCVEWTLYFRNTGQAETPILEDIQALDLSITRDGEEEEFLLHHCAGASSVKSDCINGSPRRMPGRS